MPSLYFSFYFFYIARRRTVGNPREAQITVRSRNMFDNPAIRVKFLRASTQRPRSRRERTIVAKQGYSMAAADGPNFLRPSREGLARGGAGKRSAHDIRLVIFPYRRADTSIKNIHADPFFTTFNRARGRTWRQSSPGWMGGMRGARLMQTSCFAPCNWLLSLAIPYQISSDQCSGLNRGTPAIPITAHRCLPPCGRFSTRCD